MKHVVLITSSYNGAKYLPQMFDSIAAQDYSDITIFMRDDGSTDNSVEIIRKYQSDFPSGKSIILLNDKDGKWENMGSHQSYRHLLSALPDAPYYLFCDQDDVWMPDKVSRAVQAMEQYSEEIPVLYVHNYHVCDPDLNIEHDLPSRPSVSPSEIKNINLGYIIMTGTWGGVGMSQGFNKKLCDLAFHSGSITPTVAVDCWISWVVAGMEGALSYDEKPLAYYRRHPGTFSSGDQGGLKRYKDWLKHMNRHCLNIKNGLADYKRLYLHLVSPERAEFLELFTSARHFKKAFYPHRLRKSLLDELAFRILLLFGKI